MEQVLLQQHTRLVRDTSKVLNSKVRRIIEFITLFIAFICMFTLFILHMIYITNSSNTSVNCIMTYFDENFHNLDKFNNQSINHVIAKNSYDLIRLTLNNTMPNYYEKVNYDSNNCINSNIIHKKKDLNHVQDNNYPKHNSYLFAYDRGLLMLNSILREKHNFTVLNIDISIYAECFGPPISSHLIHNYFGYDLIVLNWAIAAFDGKGFLYKVNTNELYNLNFAGDFVSKKGISLTDEKQGVILSANSGMKKLFKKIIQIIKKYSTYLQQNVGFEEWKNNNSDDILYLIYSGVTITNTRWQFITQSIDKLMQYFLFRVGVLFSTTFIFFVTTTLISYTLRETQERMLRFTYQLQYHIAHDLPFMPLVFTHLTESLVFVPIMVGIHFFLAEFFSDQFLAFLVSLMVWMGEVFSVLSLRTRASIRYFPKLFCGYFYLFHIYFFSFPYGFTYLALLTTILFVLHATMHLWNVYEVPAFEQGLVNSLVPRIGLGGGGALNVVSTTSHTSSSIASSNSTSLIQQYSHRYVANNVDNTFSPTRSVRTHSTSASPVATTSVCLNSVHNSSHTLVSMTPNSASPDRNTDVTNNTTTSIRRSTIGTTMQALFPVIGNNINNTNNPLVSGVESVRETATNCTSSSSSIRNHRIRSSSHSIYTNYNSILSNPKYNNTLKSISARETNNNNIVRENNNSMDFSEYGSMINTDFGIRLHSNSDLENVHDEGNNDMADSYVEDSYTLDLAPYQEKYHNVSTTDAIASTNKLPQRKKATTHKKYISKQQLHEDCALYSNNNQVASIYETIEMRRKRLSTTKQTNTEVSADVNNNKRTSFGNKEETIPCNDSLNNNNRVKRSSDNTDDYGYQSSQFTVFK